MFVLVSTADPADVAVPGKPWGLRALHRAQAEGDLVTLAENGRRVLRIDLPDASPESVALLTRGIADAAGHRDRGALAPPQPGCGGAAMSSSAMIRTSTDPSSAISAMATLRLGSRLR